MLSRAFTKPRKSPRLVGENGNENSYRSTCIDEYEDFIIGFMEDLPLTNCEDEDDRGSNVTLREVLRGSVGVVGESRLGMTEKVVLLQGKIHALKRFRKVSVRRGEFGRRIERLAQVSRKCKYLVPLTAYLYTKRIKFVVCDYYPMGSLADLLTGTRELGHTALQWKQRLKIIFHIARAIAFIHSQCPSYDRHLRMNVHGNLKTSNVMITVDLCARVSDYGFIQLAERVEVSDTGQPKPPPPTESLYSDFLSQKSDIYNFGIIVLDMLGGPKAPSLEKRKWIVENEELIKNGDREFFEFVVEGKEKRQALMVLEVALACTDKFPDTRPSIEQISSYLRDVCK
ncbi:hypothetical protein RJ639_007535 [Escallonia herrerae]|uniref:Protein kinase domain-containing protein n=1 Tax=Escallonia herrerae TaxID=1293975 RepID=A0AA89AVJ3_9ASTE|nr:hypothetical protein RJ639_007535 [Escallonia herrerae]